MQHNPTYEYTPYVKGPTKPGLHAQYLSDKLMLEALPTGHPDRTILERRIAKMEAQDWRRFDWECEAENGGASC